MLDYVNDDSRLLSMKMALLKYSSDDNREQALSDFEKLVTSIDSSRFDILIEKIKQADYNNLSLKEKLVFLEEIEKEYDQFYEEQCKFRDFYGLYSSKKLNLSDLSCINIVALREMRSAIDGYLSNQENISNNKERIEEINRLLVLEEKRLLSIEGKILEYEDDLREDFLKAEGRLVSLESPDKMEYASVIKEYKDNGIDLETLLNDPQELSRCLKEANREFDAGQESFNATKFCYENNRTLENEDLLKDAESQVNELRYRLILYEIANSLSRTETTYERALNKREIISRLISKRNECLRIKGIKFYIDPFSWTNGSNNGRTKISEQIQKIKNLGDNSETINKLKKELGELNSRIEEMKDLNSTLLVTIGLDLELLNERQKTSVIDEDITKDTEEVIDYGFDDLLPLVAKEISPNQVAGVHEPKEGFKYRKALEQTRSVIVRVCDLIPNEELKKEDHNTSDVIPELVIVSEPQVKIDTPVEDLSNSINVSGSLLFDDFEFDNLSSQESSNKNGIGLEIETYEPAAIFQTTNVTDVSPFDVTSSFVEPITDKIDEKEENDLFTSVSLPFEAPLFFGDKYDESLELDTKTEVTNDNALPSVEFSQGEDINGEVNVNDKTDTVPELELVAEETNSTEASSLDEEETMPDIFWDMQGDEEETEEVYSLDDQIDSLLSGSQKSRKLSV